MKFDEIPCQLLYEYYGSADTLVMIDMVRILGRVFRMNVYQIDIRGDWDEV